MDIVIQIESPVADRPALRVLRCLKRLTQAQLAYQTGISQSTLARLERGLLPSDRTVCDRIANVLGVATAVIFPELVDHGSIDGGGNEEVIGRSSTRGCER